MILIKKYRVVICIEPKMLRYQVLKSVKQPNVIDNESMFEYHYQDMTDIEMFISDLKKNIPQHSEFELNLDKTYIQVQMLTLPDAKLTLTEIELFIEASIYKLFQLPTKNVFYDFVYPPEQPKQIMVSICERHIIDTWNDLCKKYDLSLIFIGSVIENNKVNFLPWRQIKQKQHLRQLIIIVTCLMGIMGCLFCYLWIQTHNKLAYYSLQLSVKQEIQQELARELSFYLPNPSISQKQIQQSLLLISQQLPTVIWLESFVYVPQRITLQGHSLSYVEIINFNEALQQQKNITKSQVKSISLSKNDLLFEMDIELNEQ